MMGTSQGERQTQGPAGPLWAIVLAGGDGTRLQPLTRRLYGEPRPKQFAALIGTRSLLRQTLDRVALSIPPRQTVVVTRRAHAHYTAREIRGSEGPTVLAQPADRGTAAGVLFPAHWIAWQDPGAVVAVFPSDHFIVEEATFMAMSPRWRPAWRDPRTRSCSWALNRRRPIRSTAGSSPGAIAVGRQGARCAPCAASSRSRLPRRPRSLSRADGCGTRSFSWRGLARSSRRAGVTCPRCMIGWRACVRSSAPRTSGGRSSKPTRWRRKRASREPCWSPARPT